MSIIDDKFYISLIAALLRAMGKDHLISSIGGGDEMQMAFPWRYYERIMK